jgi:hypothetical protein
MEIILHVLNVTRPMVQYISIIIICSLRVNVMGYGDFVWPENTNMGGGPILNYSIGQQRWFLEKLQKRVWIIIDSYLEILYAEKNYILWNNYYNWHQMNNVDLIVFFFLFLMVYVTIPIPWHYHSETPPFKWQRNEIILITIILY